MPEAADTGFAARGLMRAARRASLATLADGAPFVSLVTPAASCAGDLLMLVSSLSRHGRQLRQDGRCALLLEGEERAANPQATPRLTVTGTAEPVQDAALHDRWVRIHPYGVSYAGFGDFSLWRLRPEQAHFIAGFGQIRSLPGHALRPPCCPAMEEAMEPPLREAANRRHGAMLAEAARVEATRIVALDADGFDLGPGPSPDPNGQARTRRIAFAASAATPDAVGDAIGTAIDAVLRTGGQGMI